MPILKPPLSTRMGTHTILMLLTNAYDPDPRVRQEALSLIGMGYRIHLLAWDRDLKAPASECIEGVEVERIFLRSAHGRGTTQLFFYALLYLKLFWRGWRTSFDAVHCHDLDTLPLGFLLGKLKRKPVVYDAHESFPDMLEGSVNRRVRSCLVALENFLIRRVDLLITVGEKLRSHFAERGARHSVVVGNWKRLEEFASTEEEKQKVRDHLGIPDNAMAVVCITQLLGDRQIDELLDATDQCPNVYTILGGRGVLETRIRERAKRNSRIIFLGFVAAREIPIYTCAANVVYYGFYPDNPNARFSAPNKLFEALAAGKPIISGDFGEIAEVVRHSNCGLVLPAYSAESVRKAFETLQDVELRNRLGRNALNLGRTEMNWAISERTLYREYAVLASGHRLGLHSSSGADESRLEIS